jgi:hypothetical protein
VNGMTAKYILGVLGVVFLIVAGIRLAKDGWKIGPASKTWLLIGVIFTVVSAWTW